MKQATTFRVAYVEEGVLNGKSVHWERTLGFTTAVSPKAAVRNYCYKNSYPPTGYIGGYGDDYLRTKIAAFSV